MMEIVQLTFGILIAVPKRGTFLCDVRNHDCWSGASQCWSLYSPEEKGVDLFAADVAVIHNEKSVGNG